MKALSIQKVGKVYPNGVTPLKEINLEVEAGDFFALLGPNGAGKTTLIGIINSLIFKTTGKVSVFGYDIDSHPLEAKSFLGVVPQEFNLNVFDTVERILIQQAGYYGVSRKAALERIDYYLQALGLSNKRKTVVRKLSGGMKRRVMIARALIHQPKLLLLDEPTAGVDIELRHQMWQFIKKLNEEKGTTIILTTHYLEEAEALCKNLAIIDHGRIIEKTSMSNLLHKLDSETFILHLKNPVLSADLSATGFECTIVEEKTIEVKVSKSQNISHLFTKLSELNIEVLSIENKMGRLESLFMMLTSHKMKLKPHEEP